MAEAKEGVWMRIVTSGNAEITGFVPGAESPNDFWITFKTHMVRVENATEILQSGKKVGHQVLHVNRDAIAFASVLPREP